MTASRRTTRVALAAVTAAACAGSMLLLAGTPAVAAPSSTGTAHSSGVVDGETYERFIVHFAEGTDARDDDRAARGELESAGRSAGHRLDFARRLATSGVLLTVPERLDAGRARGLLQRLAAHPGVEAAEPDVRMTRQADGPEYDMQWHYASSDVGIDLPSVWATADGANVNVAVLDTGITAHPDLSGNLGRGYDFIADDATSRDRMPGRDGDPTDEGDWEVAGDCGDGANPGYPSSWHGTHVAGTIAALTNNGFGVAGVAPAAKIMPVRVLGHCGGYLSDIADAILWSSGVPVGAVSAPAQAAKVINMSLGGAGRCGSTYQNAINTAVGRGTTVVVAAGNSNANAGSYQPASCANTVVVGASDKDGGQAWYSNYGSVVDLTAPGGDTRYGGPAGGVWSTLNSGKTTPVTTTDGPIYAPNQGTSMATPHVAGVAALLLGEKSMTPSAIESTLKATTETLPLGCSGGCGTGLLSAAAAVAYVTEPTLFEVTGLTTPIADSTVSSQVDVTRTGRAAAALKISVNATHDRAGDLQIDLVAPDGTPYRLKSASKGKSGGYAPTTYTINASAEAAKGFWKLQITDAYKVNSGTLYGWSLTF